MTPKILIIGIGNPLRGDDGVGALLCKYFDEKNIENVSTKVVHQLDTAWLHELNELNAIILADAAINIDKMSLQPIVPSTTQATSLTHHVSTNTFATLAKQLFDCNATFYTCAIPAQNFEMGNPISSYTLAHMQEAIQQIENLISESH